MGARLEVQQKGRTRRGAGGLPARVAATHCAATVAAVCVALTVTSVARANGRYPIANQLVVDPGDPSHIVARTTFGVLWSADAGKTWGWICENALDPVGFQDPTIAITPSHKTLVATLHGTVASSDGCAWTSSVGIDSTEYFTDFALDPKTASRAIGIETTYTGGSDAAAAHVPALFQSLDDGQSWSPLGPSLDTDIAPATVEVAPSGRIYVSGYRYSTRGGVFARSDDDGATFTTTDIDLAGASSIYIAALDPKVEGRVYLRTAGGTADGGPSDRLIVTDDGGQTFRTVYRVDGGLFGFAVSPDGAAVAIGGPTAGINVAPTDTFAFTQTSTVGPWCLTWTNQGLFVCAKESKDGFTIGLSTDRGATFPVALLRLIDLAPLACAADSMVTTTCTLTWPTTRASFYLDGGTDASASGGATGGLATGSVGINDAGPPRTGCACAVPGAHSGAPARQSIQRRTAPSESHGLTTMPFGCFVTLTLASLMRRRRQR